MFSRKQLVKLLIPLIIEQFMNVLVGMVDVVMAVSYTHLDVYKRQAYHHRPDP